MDLSIEKIILIFFKPSIKGLNKFPLNLIGLVIQFSNLIMIYLTKFSKYNPPQNPENAC